MGAGITVSKMKISETIILGIVQGLTEFLPVSSSGHLVAIQNLLGFREPQLLLDCSLHLGTLLAVCLYFRSDLKHMATEIGRLNLKEPHSSLAWGILAGSVPTALIGLVFRTPLERLFGSVTLAGAMLIFTGVILAVTKVIPKGHATRSLIGLFSALAVGTAQGLAILPGISRSGATIVCALLCGVDRELAGRFSFLLSIPAIIGSLALQFNIEDLQLQVPHGLDSEIL